MADVTDEVLSLVLRQVSERGIVVWYDPEMAYGAAVDRVTDAIVLKFSGSFLEFRHKLEPFLEFIRPDGMPDVASLAAPRVIAYVPRDRQQAAHALVEAESAGGVMRPGAEHWSRNTSLRVVAERVFRQIAPDRAASIARQVEQGALCLDDLDRLAERAADIGSGAVSLIFGTAAATDVAIAFASSDRHDEEIARRNAMNELAGLLRSEMGLEVPADQTPGSARTRLRQLLLLTEYFTRVETAGGSVGGLDNVGIPKSRPHRAAVAHTVQEWRNRMDRSDDYAQAAMEVEHAAALRFGEIPAAQLTNVETFLGVELALQKDVERRHLGGDAQGAIATAVRRRRSFWSAREPVNQLRWSLLETASRLAVAALRIRSELKPAREDLAALVGAYTRDREPWCLLDTYHRHLERQYSVFDLDGSGQHDSLEQVVRRCRREYLEVAGLCAEAATSALEGPALAAGKLLTQDRVFNTMVAPQLAAAGAPAKVAYVLVDALRFEMGRELLEGLGTEFDAHLMPAVAQLPSITEVGMAALLPGAEKGLELVEAGPGKVAIRIGAAVVRDRASRMKHFREAIGPDVVDLKLNDLMKPAKRIVEQIAASRLIVVTSQEIDQFGESSEGDDEARRYIDEVLEKLRRGLRRLAALGVGHAIVVADHGHLFADPLEEGMKIDPPGGTTVDLHRRAWIGRGGNASASFLRLPVSRVGLRGDLELAVPRGLAGFKVKGGSNVFFHGGASLQELIIPVAFLTARSSTGPDTAAPTLTLDMDRKKITNRLFTVTATFNSSGLFPSEQKRVLALVHVGRTQVGAAAAAAHGFEEGTGEIVLQRGRPNVITMLLTVETDSRTASVTVVDAATQVELARLNDVPLSLTI